MLRRPELIVIAGPNGSGKTSITSQLIEADWSPGVYINPDEIAQRDFDGWNDPASVEKAALRAEELRESLLARHESMTFETVLSTRGKVDFIRRAKEAGFFVRVFFVCTDDPTINAKRVARRVMEGGHTVPIEKIIARYARSLDLASEALALADRGYLYDNTDDDCAPWLVMRTIGGELVDRYLENIQGEHAPRWACKVLDDLAVRRERHTALIEAHEAPTA